MSRKKKILFLYFELAGYTVACMKHLADHFDAEVHVVNYPVNSVAPFEFSFGENITTYNRSSYTNAALIQLTEGINPDLIYVCGWADKGYLAVCKNIQKRIPVVMTLDNIWKGNIKQHIATLIAPFYLSKLFTHCWIPGPTNADYAKRLGFKENQILQGLYCADVDLYNSYYEETKATKETKFPHRFVFVGRYTELKGTQELWNVFSNLTNEERKDWELYCMGKGPLENEFPHVSFIKNIGFIQPDQLSSTISQTGVFILPTHYEHWGVVVQEYALAGYPLICSTTTSAATAYLTENENGFYCAPKNEASLKEAILKIINSDDTTLVAMMNKSHVKGNKNTPEKWAQTLLQLINS